MSIPDFREYYEICHDVMNEMHKNANKFYGLIEHNKPDAGWHPPFKTIEEDRKWFLEAHKYWKKRTQEALENIP